jgi:hypothetical protein
VSVSFAVRQTVVDATAGSHPVIKATLTVGAATGTSAGLIVVKFNYESVSGSRNVAGELIKCKKWG